MSLFCPEGLGLFHKWDEARHFGCNYTQTCLKCGEVSRGTSHRDVESAVVGGTRGWRCRACGESGQEPESH
jgi:hypothetical protein